MVARKPDNLFKEIRKLIVSARSAVARNVDIIQVITNFEIGRRIVLFEQGGARRAEYGKELLSELSNRLTAEFGRGFSLTNLKLMRQFYMLNAGRIGQTISDQFTAVKKGHKASDLFVVTGKQSGKTVLSSSREQSLNSLNLSWSHHVFLMSISDRRERGFYEIEASQQGWSLSELKRQFDSSLYERLALGRNKGEIRKLARRGQLIAKPQDLLKEPYVLEFLGLEERSKYSENQLEAAIIDKLEHFLLELGKGFLFEARQKRFTFDEDHFFVDLVFYNRLLRCYVLIDLKIGKLTHQDLGQMQMYVNYFDRHVRSADERPSIGIILCKRKNDALVQITLPRKANVHAREYRLYLPSKEELGRKLLEWSDQKGE